MRASVPAATTPHGTEVGISETLPWYLYSILTSLSLVGLVLCIRWLTNQGYAPKRILLFMVGIALLGFAALAGPGLARAVGSPNLLGFLLYTGLAGAFATVGHWAEFEAIKRAPNPGYATAIRSCSILPVIVFSVFLFDSTLTIFKLTGALLILGGILALVIEKDSPPKGEGRDAPGKRLWIILALTALTCYSLMVLGIKKATLLGFAPPEICVGIYLVNFVFFAVINLGGMRAYFRDRDGLRQFLPLVIVAALFAMATNLLNVKGLEMAPNPGYHEAIRNTNILLVTLLAVPLFGAHFDKAKMVGVVVILVGIVVMVVC